MEEEAIAIIAVIIGLSWLVVHYMTRWKTAPTLTAGDEALLEELYQLARRLEERVDTVERLTAHDNPAFERPRLVAARDTDHARLDELERLIQERYVR